MGKSEYKPVVCTRCLAYDYPKTRSKANAGVGCALMFLFIIPGLIYFALAGNEKVCAHCEGEIVPADSQRGKQLLAQKPSS